VPTGTLGSNPQRSESAEGPVGFYEQSRRAVVVQLLDGSRPLMFDVRFADDSLQRVTAIRR
jgi:hypothetical protein